MMPRSVSHIQGASYFLSRRIFLNILRFLVVVLSVYKQMRLQDQPVLVDFDEENFDRAFGIIRPGGWTSNGDYMILDNAFPVIQGDPDVGKRMSEDELQKAIAFCGGTFIPVDQEQRTRVASRLDHKLFDPQGPIATPEEMDQLVPDDREAQLVLKEINGHKSIVGNLFASVGGFSDEVVVGFSARVKRGSIGLTSHLPNAMSVVERPLY